MNKRDIIKGAIGLAGAIGVGQAKRDPYPDIPTGPPPSTWQKQSATARCEISGNHPLISLAQEAIITSVNAWGLSEERRIYNQISAVQRLKSPSEAWKDFRVNQLRTEANTIWKRVQEKIAEGIKL